MVHDDGVSDGIPYGLKSFHHQLKLIKSLSSRLCRKWIQFAECPDALQSVVRGQREHHYDSFVI
jgi:hypothetical protein